MTMETLFFIWWSIISPSVTLWAISMAEATHDYCVIAENSNGWHVWSAFEKFFWVCFAFLCAYLGKDAIYGILLYPAIRGLTFWPYLNHLLGRYKFSLSDHLIEGWFKRHNFAGKYLFLFYVTFYILQIFISVILWKQN